LASAKTAVICAWGFGADDAPDETLMVPRIAEAATIVVSGRSFMKSLFGRHVSYRASGNPFEARRCILRNGRGTCGFFDALFVSIEVRNA
jgi:hypothetical protein